MTIVAGDGTQVLTFLTPTSYTTMLIAGSRLEDNKTYTIFTGGEANGTDFNGLYLDGTYTTGKVVSSFTTSARVTKLGGSVSRG